MLIKLNTLDAYLKTYILLMRTIHCLKKKIPLGHNGTNDTVYSKNNFKIEICSAF